MGGLAASLQDALETADALGRSMLIERDRQLSDVISASYSSSEWIACSSPGVNVSFDVIPQATIDYLRSVAFTVSGVEYGEILLLIKKKLIQAINDGATASDFFKQINGIFDAYGITRLNRRHIDTVFRTNASVAYSAGQLEQALAMPDSFKVWQYSAIRDGRTRESHWILNGRVFRVGKGPLPPIDYNCRCSAIYLHVSERGAKDAEDYGGVEQSFVKQREFEKWKASKGDVITPSIQLWLEKHV